jgi:hypothetical protein
MKVVIAGSRSIESYEEVLLAISSSPFLITEIVSGHALGVDHLGERYALDNNLALALYPANWEEYGRKAGMIRNAKMADYADAAIVVWDGKSKGSKNMIDNMKKRQKPCHVWVVS